MSYRVERGDNGISAIILYDAAGKHTRLRLADYGLALDITRELNNAKSSYYEMGYRAGSMHMLNAGREALEREQAMHRHPSSHV